MLLDEYHGYLAIGHHTLSLQRVRIRKRLSFDTRHLQTFRTYKYVEAISVPILATAQHSFRMLGLLTNTVNLAFFCLVNFHEVVKVSILTG